MADVKFRKHVCLSERVLAALLGMGEVADARVWVEEGGRYVHVVGIVDSLEELGDRIGESGVNTGWFRLLPENRVDISRFVPPAPAAVFEGRH